MPVRLGSKLPAESSEARIEIVPLIDILFFLLAAFMLVSLGLVNLKGVPVNLPVAAGTAPAVRTNLLSLSVDRTGLLSLEGAAVGPSELAGLLVEARRSDPGVRVLLRGDQDARHGDVIRALDLVRGSGIERVVFETREAGGKETGTP